MVAAGPGPGGAGPMDGGTEATVAACGWAAAPAGISSGDPARGAPRGVGVWLIVEGQQAARLGDRLTEATRSFFCKNRMPCSCDSEASTYYS